MPKFLESALRHSAKQQGLKGTHADAYVYGAMNNLGAMKGNQETAKGRSMAQKHVSGRSRVKTSHPGFTSVQRALDRRKK